MNFRSILSLYDPRLAQTIIGELKNHRYSGWRFLDWFWHTDSYQPVRPLTDRERSAATLIGLLMMGQLGIGIWLVVDSLRSGTVGAWAFGLALILSYPLVWSHLLAFGASIGWLMYFVFHPKKAARSFICTLLEWQVRQLRARHKFTVVAVAGSVGKTSTKLAIADLLGQSLRVRYQTGNYNDRVTVPLVFFGLSEPSLYNVIGWIKALGITQSEIALPYPYDVVVVELGTDGPGQMSDFAYIKPDITVVTAITPEHMEFFADLDAVAAEELTVFNYSKRVLVNGDDIADEYLAGREFTEYSLTSDHAQYVAHITSQNLEGQTLQIQTPKGEIAGDVRYVGPQGAKVALAAVAVAHMLGQKPSIITKGLPELLPFAGRMQVLPGIKDSTLIDDTYNASPIAVTAALDALYATKTPQRIAVLGSMNELGAYAAEAHREVGAYCDPKKLAVVVTVGKDAKRWLAPAARERGCTVHAFLNPREAGEYVSGKLKSHGVVLAKGSQNGVFAEEALKPLLADPTDAAKLVRQNSYWLSRKAKQFGD